MISFQQQPRKAVDEKEQACEDRQSAEQKLRSVLLEFDAKISEEKEYVVSNMEARLGSINDQVSTTRVYDVALI